MFQSKIPIIENPYKDVPKFGSNMVLLREREDKRGKCRGIFIHRGIALIYQKYLYRLISL